MMKNIILKLKSLITGDVCSRMGPLCDNTYFTLDDKDIHPLASRFAKSYIIWGKTGTVFKKKHSATCFIKYYNFIFCRIQILHPKYLNAEFLPCLYVYTVCILLSKPTWYTPLSYTLYDYKMGFPLTSMTINN